MEIDDIDTALEQNERNLYAIQKTKIQQLEKKVLSQEHVIKDWSNKFKELEDDFNYNVQVIHQRDQDLEETMEKLIQLKGVYDHTQQKLRQIEEQGLLQRQKLQNDLDEVLDRFESNRQEQRYAKKRYEDQIKDLKFMLQQKEDYIAKISEELKIKDLSGQYQLIQQELLKEKEIHTELASALEQKLQTQQIALDQSKSDLQNSNDLRLTLEEKIKEMLKEKEIHTELASAFKHENIVLKQKLQTQQITLDQFKSDLQNSNDLRLALEEKFKDKLSTITEERDLLLTKLQQTQLDKKQKVNYIKENCDRKLQETTRDCQERISKNDYEKQLVTIDYEKLCVQERHLQERILELEGRLRREQADQEQRLQLYSRNQDQNRRQMQNEIEMKEFQSKQVKEDNERQQEQIKQLNQAVDDLQNKVQELSNENKILITEIVKYRKMDMNPKQSDLLSKKQPKQSSPRQRKFLIQEDEVESFDQMFSDDQGPAPQMSQKISQQRSKLVASNSRLRELDNQVYQLKQIIEEITLDYDKAKNKLILNNQEINILKNENLDHQKKNYNLLTEITQLEAQIQKLLGGQNQSKELLQMQQMLTEREAQIESLNKRITQFQQVIHDLKAEREMLLEITNDLNQKVRDEEDDSEQYKQQLLKLQSDIDYLNKELQIIQTEKSNKIINSTLKVEQVTKTFVEQQKEQIKQIKDRYNKPQQRVEQQLSLSEITQTVLQSNQNKV